MVFNQGNVPDEFVCPLTLQIFKSPVMNKYGINYERAAIIEWLDRGHDICPMTRQPLTLSGLCRNQGLKQRIDEWKTQKDDSGDGEDGSSCEEINGKQQQAEEEDDDADDDDDDDVDDADDRRLRELGIPIMSSRKAAKKNDDRPNATTRPRGRILRRNWLFSVRGRQQRSRAAQQRP